MRQYLLTSAERFDICSCHSESIQMYNHACPLPAVTINLQCLSPLELQLFCHPVKAGVLLSICAELIGYVGQLMALP